jgi:hypothetical protein
MENDKLKKALERHLDAIKCISLIFNTLMSEGKMSKETRDTLSYYIENLIECPEEFLYLLSETPTLIAINGAKHTARVLIHKV